MSSAIWTSSKTTSKTSSRKSSPFNLNCTTSHLSARKTPFLNVLNKWPSFMEIKSKTNQSWKKANTILLYWSLTKQTTKIISIKLKPFSLPNPPQNSLMPRSSSSVYFLVQELKSLKKLNHLKSLKTQKISKQKNTSFYYKSFPH